MADLVALARDGGVATITLNRPEKRNALSIELRRELAEAFRSVSADEAVAAVVLTGAGSAFCAGMDTSQFGGDEANRRALFDTTAEVFASLRAVPVPTVAAVNGPALGGGLVLAAACDLRLASPPATFGSPEIRFGVPPSYGAWVRIVPPQLARELSFTGRVLDAEEALAAGVVYGLHEDVVPAAQTLAAEFAKHGRKVLAMVKELIAAAGDDASAAAERAEIEMFRRALFGTPG